MRRSLLVGLFFFSAPYILLGEDSSSSPSSVNSQKVFQARFESQIWPLLLKGTGKDSCVGCHNPENKQTQLHYYQDPKENFRFLLTEGYFDPENPDALIRRVATKSRRKRMPPKPQPAWDKKQIQVLKRFSEEVTENEEAGKLKVASDEEFPPELLKPFKGESPEGLDNTFLSYYQLQGRFSVLFPKDDGMRGNRHLFQENLQLLGGADFKKSFNESTKATASFFSALDLIAKAYLEKAYRERSAPFYDARSWSLEDLKESVAKRDAWKPHIESLFQSILYRSPTPAELQKANDLLLNIVQKSHSIRGRARIIGLRLTVEDPSTQKNLIHDLRIPIEPSSLGLYQEYLDQSQKRNSKDWFVLKKSFKLKKNQREQAFRLYNEGTYGNVSFSALRLRKIELGENEKSQEWVIKAEDPQVEAQGNWKKFSRSGMTGWEDQGFGKGMSQIIVPLKVPEDGKYEIALKWRVDSGQAKEVLAEVVAPGASHLALRSAPKKLPQGFAAFFVDQTEDTKAFFDLGASFKFGEKDFVEISNKGTKKLVTADAVRFIQEDQKPFIVDNHEADGREGWSKYKSPSFNAYNKVGPDRYEDKNAKKGQLHLKYRPSIRKKSWNSKTFYRPQVGFAAKRHHETRTPVTVRAEASTPILNVRAPRAAHTGAKVTVDANGTFTVQHSPLNFSWEQTEGPKVDLKTQGAKVVFEAPPRDISEVAWVALGRALISHPDFLLTRAPSITKVKDPLEKRKLQLVKLALDLVGRPPSSVEIVDLVKGAKHENMVEYFLKSEEFKKFYFHRVRLYLESQGTPSQDEPVRLWSYVAYNDLPIQEILTADYTVNEKFKKVKRPAFHGKSGVLTTAGFIEGKPGLPHYNYSAQVAEKFLGYVFEITPEIEAERAGSTAISTTAEGSTCYSCHKILTPLAHQRLRWDDKGQYRKLDPNGEPIDQSDHGLVKQYPFKGEGMEAFALKAAKKERFLRTMINTHYIFFSGREMRIRDDERVLYREIWDQMKKENHSVRSMLRVMLNSKEYLEGLPRPKIEVAKESS